MNAKPTVRNAKLQTKLQDAQKMIQANYNGVFRDVRFRAPHQQAIMKSVNSVLKTATKQVRLGEHAQLSNAIEALRVFRNKNASHLAGRGDPRVILSAFSRMKPLVNEVYAAAKLPKIAETDVSPR